MLQSKISETVSPNLESKENRLLDVNIAVVVLGPEVTISNAFAIRELRGQIGRDIWEVGPVGDLLIRRSLKIPPDGSADLSIPKLTEALASALDIQKKLFSKISTSSPGDLSLYIGADTPYSTLAKILYSVGQADFYYVRAAVYKKGNHYWVDLVRPKRAPGPNHRMKSCVEPRIAVTEQGLYVSVRDGRVWKSSFGSDEQEGGEGWQGKLILRTDGICPSVEENSENDRAIALRELLDRTKKFAKPCFTSRVTAAPNINFGRILTVMRSLQIRKPFGWVTMEQPLEKTSWTEECAKGLILE